MIKTVKQKIEFARNVWFIFMTAIFGFKLIEYLASPSFPLLIEAHGIFNAILLVILMFLLMYALFIAPALIMHVLLWGERTGR